MSTESIAGDPKRLPDPNGKAISEDKKSKIQKKKTQNLVDTSEEWEVEMRLVETRLLLCRSILNQIKMINGMNEEEDTKQNDEVVNEIDNNLPLQEDLNNEFTTDHINMVAMNVCGIKGKEKIVQSIFHKSDIRVGVLSETWLTGKEKPELGRSFDSFISNRAEKSNRGGIAVVVEKTIAEETVVIGRNEKGEDLEWVGVRLNSFQPPVVVFGVYGCQSSKNTSDESLRKWTEQSWRI